MCSTPVEGGYLIFFINGAFARVAPETLPIPPHTLVTELAFGTHHQVVEERGTR